MFRILLVVCFAGSVGLWGRSASDTATVATELARELSARYAPYADWTSAVEIAELAAKAGSVDGYWRPAERIRATRLETDPRLAGLHLALDPGHIGGEWAPWEGRHFRMGDSDHWVMEGELVLEVARRVRDSLEALGARVTLLREAPRPVNPRGPIDYLERAAALVERPSESTFSALRAYGEALRAKAVGLAIISGDLAERARLVNEVIRPDALISLHSNAAVWPTDTEGETAGQRRLVDSNHLHVLIFGCMSATELASPRQRERLEVKLLNGSGAEERALADALGRALANGTGLPPSLYGGNNAVRVIESNPYVFARNLMLLRLVDCPSVLLEPYIANSEAVYARIQRALTQRAAGEPLAADDILAEYAAAVVAGVLEAYGNP